MPNKETKRDREKAMEHREKEVKRKAKNIRSKGTGGTKDISKVDKETR